MSTKLIILTGTYPPEICGVGDYVHNLLSSELAKKWSLKYFKNWSIKFFFEILNDLLSTDVKNINLQYPTMGYGGSIIPHLLSIYFRLFTKVNFSVTIHESSQLSLKAKLGTYILFVFSKRIIFTNIFELNEAKKKFYWIANKSEVIKIYSNIESFIDLKPTNQRYYDVVYFGLIRPQKGLEEFVKLIHNLSAEKNELKFAIIGMIQPECEVFSKEIFKSLAGYSVDFHLNKPANDVSELLSESKCAYMIYPDGMSERRGSALAIIKNGCYLITKRGPFTTEPLDKICAYCDNSNSKEIVERLIAQGENDFERFMQAVNDYIMTEIPDSWDSVADKYINFLKL